MAIPPMVLGALEALNRSRLLPGFVHDRWDRLFAGERALLPIFGVPVRPITIGMAFGLTAIPDRWEA